MAGSIVPLEQGLVITKSGMELFRTPKNVGGRPKGRVSYEPELARRILWRLANGESLLDICDSEPIDFSTVIDWSLDNVQGFAPRYARARLSGCYHINEQCIRIADDARNDWMLLNDPENIGWRFNGEHVARTKIRIEQRRFFLTKIAPRVFGDKLDLRIKPDDEFAADQPVSIDKVTAKQLEVIERLAAEAAAAGVRIKIVGIDQPAGVSL